MNLRKLHRVNHVETEVFFKRVEVAVTVQERMAAGDAERSDVAVDSFAHGASAPAEKSIVLGRGYCEVCASSVEDDKPGEQFSRSIEFAVLPDPLKRFAQNQIDQPEALLTRFPENPGRLRSRSSG
jgi:hypothetical protein